MSSKTCLHRQIYGARWKTKQIKKRLGESMHTLEKREEYGRGRRDSSHSIEKREWRTEENVMRTRAPLIYVR
jgi:hypothetical protein